MLALPAPRSMEVAKIDRYELPRGSKPCGRLERVGFDLRLNADFVDWVPVMSRSPIFLVV